MQRHPGNEHVALNQRLTLLLMAKDQPDFLRRALKYYSGFACSIVVVDASAQPDADISNAGGLHYIQHAALANASLASRIAEGLKHVSTPFVVQAPVDSFLLPDALTAALSFLEDNQAYGACQGYSLGYQAQVNQVSYFRRDRKTCEDYASDNAGERVLSFMSEALSLLSAVTRSELAQRWFMSLAEDTEPHWQEIGHMNYLVAAARLRVLPIPYALHLMPGKEVGLRYGASIAAAVRHIDPKARGARETFARELVALLGEGSGLEGAQGDQKILAGLAAMAERLKIQGFQADEKIISAVWNVALEKSDALFEPRQFV
ncbi:TIGR00180 family glycosyltransferase, partial [Pseudomonas viridiflava]